MIWGLDVLGQAFWGNICSPQNMWMFVSHGLVWGTILCPKGHGAKAAPQSCCPLPCLGSEGEGGLGHQCDDGVGIPLG